MEAVISYLFFALLRYLGTISNLSAQRLLCPTCCLAVRRLASFLIQICCLEAAISYMLSCWMEDLLSNLLFYGLEAVIGLFSFFSTELSVLVLFAAVLLHEGCSLLLCVFQPLMEAAVSYSSAVDGGWRHFTYRFAARRLASLTRWPAAWRLPCPSCCLEDTISYLPFIPGAAVSDLPFGCLEAVVDLPAVWLLVLSCSICRFAVWKMLCPTYCLSVNGGSLRSICRPSPWRLPYTISCLAVNGGCLPCPTYWHLLSGDCHFLICCFACPETGVFYSLFCHGWMMACPTCICCCWLEIHYLIWILGSIIIWSKTRQVECRLEGCTEILLYGLCSMTQKSASLLVHYQIPDSSVVLEWL